MERDPRLVYPADRVGQDGPYAQLAGHDINYVAIGGPLGAGGLRPPVPALNLLGDFASGSFPAVLGTVLALLARERTGRAGRWSTPDGRRRGLPAVRAVLELPAVSGTAGAPACSPASPVLRRLPVRRRPWVRGSIEQVLRAAAGRARAGPRSARANSTTAAGLAAARAAIAQVSPPRPREHWAAVLPARRRGAYTRSPNWPKRPPTLASAARGSVRPDDAGARRSGLAPRLSRTPGTAGPLRPVSPGRASASCWQRSASARRGRWVVSNQAPCTRRLPGPR